MKTRDVTEVRSRECTEHSTGCRLMPSDPQCLAFYFLGNEPVCLWSNSSSSTTVSVSKSGKQMWRKVTINNRWKKSGWGGYPDTRKSTGKKYESASRRYSVLKTAPLWSLRFGNEWLSMTLTGMNSKVRLSLNKSIVMLNSANVLSTSVLFSAVFFSMFY